MSYYDLFARDRRDTRGTRGPRGSLGPRGTPPGHPGDTSGTRLGPSGRGGARRGGRDTAWQCKQFTTFAILHPKSLRLSAEIMIWMSAECKLSNMLARPHPKSLRLLAHLSKKLNRKQRARLRLVQKTLTTTEGTLEKM